MMGTPEASKIMASRAAFLLVEDPSRSNACKMAVLGSPLSTFRSLLRELRYVQGGTARSRRDTAASQYLREAFRAHRVRGEQEGAPYRAPYRAQRVFVVTSEKLCRAQHELHFQAATYLCLLRSVREHLALHQEYHGRGECSPEEVAGRVGLRLPQQPGGKGWEP
ncbi:hypothetical protein lerEdw1_003861 [Lerista edwardsae]|nr:hypothetical protein lerEdw1_003861 [Lerista edwardsae]